MKIIRDLKSIKKKYPYPIITLGSFDGMHLGHRKIVREVVKRAGEVKGTSIVLTFTPHPRRIINLGKGPGLLTEKKEKLELIRCLGIDVCILVNFNKKFSGMSAEDFIVDVFHKCLGVKEIFLGPDYRFGRERRGNPALLRKMGKLYGFRVKRVRPCRRGGEAVSSTRIRRLIEKGLLKEAGALLGRPYAITGRVRTGRAAARAIGYPTANLTPGEAVCPAPGAYAAGVIRGKSFHPAIAGIVERGSKKTVEAHLLDFAGNLYGRKITVIFISKLRQQQNFPSRSAVKKKLRKDEIAARKRLAKFLFTKYRPRAILEGKK